MRTRSMRLRILALVGALTVWPASLLAVQGPAEAVASESKVRRGDMLVVNGDRVIGQNEVVEGDVVMVAGSLRIAGEVLGDVAVAVGDLVLAPGAVVHGDVVVKKGRLVNEGARVLGEIQSPDRPRTAGGVGASARTSMRIDRGWAGTLGDGLVGIYRTLTVGLLLAGLGAALVFFALPQVNSLTSTVRQQLWRSGLVGGLGAFLTIPVGIALAVGLVLTVIGIPVMLLAVPLYTLAAISAALVGFVIAAHAFGEFTAERRGLFDPDHRNGYSYVLTGTGMLLAPLVVVQAVQVIGLPGLVETALVGFALAVPIFATIVGFGAVLTAAAGSWSERQRRKRFDRAVGMVLEDDPEAVRA